MSSVNWSLVSSRFLGALIELSSNSGVDLLPRNCVLLVHPKAPKAEQPHSHGI